MFKGLNTLIGLIAVVLLIGGCSDTSHKPSPPAQTVINCAKFVKDINLPDGTEVQKGQTVNKGWSILNCGTQAWSQENGYSVKHREGPLGPDTIPFCSTEGQSEGCIPSIGPDKEETISFDIKVSDGPGRQRTTYCIFGPDSKPFQDCFWFEPKVVS